MKTAFSIAEELIGGPKSTVHLMGVAGVGMAGLAAHLHWLGFGVSGCDLKSNYLTEWLNGIGIATQLGHSPRHISAQTTCLIRSTAVPDDHPEVLEARSMGAEVLRRGEVLAALVGSRPAVAVAGSHGKTSTSAMLAQALRSAGVDAGFFVGAFVDALGGVAGPGSDVFVAEADESDGTLAGYRPEYSIITNAEIDHLEHHGGPQQLWDCFGRVVSQTKSFVVANCDDERVGDIVSSRAKRVISYGFADRSDVRGSDFEQNRNGSVFNVVCPDRASVRLSLPVCGLHNAYNALAVCAFGINFGLDLEIIAAGLRNHGSARRRFEHVCQLHGADIYLDYAHHPTEIRALLQSIRAFGERRVIAAFQPHRYTRTLSLGSDFPASFEGVDQLVIAPIFAASEAPLPGGTAEDLHHHFGRAGFGEVELADDLESVWATLKKWMREGDIVLIVGAGDVEIIAQWSRSEATKTM